MYTALVREGHDARLLQFKASDDGTIAGSHKSPQNKAHWYVGCLGITEPCSTACETAFQSCVNARNISTAMKRAEAFEECMLESGSLSGCSPECSPTFNMLRESEKPAVAEFSEDRFGAGATERGDDQPLGNLCNMDEQ